MGTGRLGRGKQSRPSQSEVKRWVGDAPLLEIFLIPPSKPIVCNEGWFGS